MLVYDSVAARSGHSTYRVLFKMSPIDQRVEQRWKLLNQMGCTYEENISLSSPMCAIDVPPAADMHKVYQILKEGEADDLWEFEERHCGKSVS